MNQGRDFEGRDLDEALRLASAELGIAGDELHYEVLEQGRRGLLGMGTRNVRIRVKPPIEHLSNEQILKGEDVAPPPPPPAVTEPQTARPSERPERQARAGRPRGGGPPNRPRPRDDEEEELGDRPPQHAPRREPRPAPPEAAPIVATVQRMLELSGLDLAVEAEGEESGIVLRVDGADRGIWRQRRGELASAYQFLLNRMARRSWPEVGRILVASGGGSDGRDDRLVSMARNAAKQVARTGRTKKLRPMNAYERRLVHLAIREFPGLTSTSDGDGSLKCVRISKIRNELEVRRSTT